MYGYALGDIVILARFQIGGDCKKTSDVFFKAFITAEDYFAIFSVVGTDLYVLTTWKVSGAIGIEICGNVKFFWKSKIYGSVGDIGKVVVQVHVVIKLPFLVID